MAKLADASGKVYAFEPTNWYRERLTWHVNANHFEDRIEVIPFGLSNCRETLEIEIDNISATLHQIRAAKPEDLFKENIEMDTLDALNARMKFDPIDFVKVDIDGHEPFMLEGAQDFFRRNLPIMVIEFSQISLDVAGSDVREVKKKLDDMGYTLFSEKTYLPMDRMGFLRECGDFSHSANAWAIPAGKIQNLSELF
jgi:FkbM family methyltransferase